MCSEVFVHGLAGKITRNHGRNSGNCNRFKRTGISSLLKITDKNVTGIWEFFDDHARNTKKSIVPLINDSNYQAANVNSPISTNLTTAFTYPFYYTLGTIYRA